jgi:hypothetical protein
MSKQPGFAIQVLARRDCTGSCVESPNFVCSCCTGKHVETPTTSSGVYDVVYKKYMDILQEMKGKLVTRLILRIS